MWPSWLIELFVLLQERWSARRDTQIRFLKAQLDMLRSRLPGNRVILSPAERARLLRIGEELNHDVKHTLGIVTLKTYRKWINERRAKREPGKVGRPRMPEWLREIIIRIAKENPNSGCRKILGELKKLALKANRTSLRRVLKDEGLLPDPYRHAPKGVQTTWRKFIEIYMNVMVATDFFCKTIWTPMGRKTAYSLVFIHLASRKVFLSPSTYNPHEGWVCQQARNVSMWAEDEGIDIRFLIRDRDTKFTASFDTHFEREDGGVVRTPYESPVANCYAESWIGKCRAEVLNHFFCFSLRQLDYILRSYKGYYNTLRPHQGLDNQTIPAAATCSPDPPPIDSDFDPGTTHCQPVLGGLLRHYYRDAA